MLLPRQMALAVTRHPNLTTRRLLSSQPPPLNALRSRLFSRKVAYATAVSFGIVGVTLASPMVNASTDTANTQPNQDSMSALIRSYVVYSICSVPSLVDSAPSVLSFCQSIPGLKQIAEAFVRVTFFDHFVGAATAEETIPLLTKFRAQNKGVLLAYSVEVDEKTATLQASTGTSGRSKALHHKRNVEEMLHSIDVAGDFEDRHAADAGKASNVSGRRTWVAIKLSALVPSADSLSHLSKYIINARPHDQLVYYPGTPQPSDLDVLFSTTPLANSSLTKADLDALRALRDDLRRICMKAKERNVKLVLDAEYTWFQAAIDAFQLSLMREFNVAGKLTNNQAHVQPLVYGTYQAYLRRNTLHLLRNLELAQEENFILGVKLVRGAYHEQERDVVAPYEPDTDLIHRRLAIALKPLSKDEVQEVTLPDYSTRSKSPTWNNKWETDGAYNSAALILVDQLKQENPFVGVLFGTHNRQSCDIILRSLISNGLAKADKEMSTVQVEDRIAERFAFGQLYGMNDALTDYLAGILVASSPIILKYVPYGSLSEVIPYLGRRAIENKSVLGASMGGAVDERKRAGKKVWRRLTGSRF
ncbi:hypothetical protein FRB96_004626 [Tulasnella sp. 330]|nr:hypothetical protein FRB96_004626 [Tulasnella sp. 330]KAG8886327.1 hypothetical protein FRB98_001312 [Tulasnella sp. 332]